MDAQGWSRWHHRFHQHLLDQPELLPQRQRLLLAVSGGQDSIALLRLLLDLRHLHQWELKLWHGDHRWHEGSEQIANELQSWCTKHSVALIVSQAEPDQASTEASARNWRYCELLSHCNRLSCDAVTAHTASDRAETMLFNLSRGSDLAGLGSLPSQRVLSTSQPDGPTVRRPFLVFSRQDTAAICRDLQLPIWLDPSNASQIPARNRIRHSVLPVLEELHPGCSLRMAATAERLSRQSQSRTELADLALQQLRSEAGLDRRRLGSLTSTTRTLILARWLEASGVTGVSAALLDQLSQRLRTGQPGGQACLSRGWTLTWQGGTVKLEPMQEKPATSKPTNERDSTMKTN